jgi:GNAT superfamily N-acetyltransferase
VAVPISHAQIDRVANVLSEAFFNDPMFTYILPEEQRRLAPLKWFFKSGIRYGLSYGSVYTTHDREGGAIWLRPGSTTIHFLGMLRSGMVAAPLKFGWQSFGRFLTLSNTTEVAHKRLISQPHYYLLALGVSPVKQRRGIGSDLIQPIISKADREGFMCYLETEQEHNIAFYECHGFYVAHEGKVPHDGPRFWAMARDPQ